MNRPKVNIDNADTKKAITNGVKATKMPVLQLVNVCSAVATAFSKQAKIDGWSQQEIAGVIAEARKEPMSFVDNMTEYCILPKGTPFVQCRKGVEPEVSEGPEI